MTLHKMTGIPEFVQMTIYRETKKLLSSSYFHQDEREDIIQDLILFYLEKFGSLSADEAYIVVSIRNAAKNKLRDRRFLKQKIVPLSGSNQANPINDFEDTQENEKINHLENKKDVFKIMAENMDGVEQKILLFLFNGASINEIARSEHISKNTIREILQKIRKKYIF